VVEACGKGVHLDRGYVAGPSARTATAPVRRGDLPTNGDGALNQAPSVLVRSVRRREPGSSHGRIGRASTVLIPR
jgi:hypothetical protein